MHGVEVVRGVEVEHRRHRGAPESGGGIVHAEAHAVGVPREAEAHPEGVTFRDGDVAERGPGVNDRLPDACAAPRLKLDAREGAVVDTPAACHREGLFRGRGWRVGVGGLQRPALRGLHDGALRSREARRHRGGELREGGAVARAGVHERLRRVRAEEPRHRGEKVRGRRVVAPERDAFDACHVGCSYSSAGVPASGVPVGVPGAVPGGVVARRGGVHCNGVGGSPRR